VADDWADVEAEFRRIVTESDPPFDAETIANAEDFLRYLRGQTPIPVIKRGYWPTLAIWWEYAPATQPQTMVQFEVFASRIEIAVYRDKGPKLAAAQVSLQYAAHKAGEPFPPEIEAEMPPNRSWVR
jgi:hypothetical protein